MACRCRRIARSTALCLQREAEVDAIVTGWTKEGTKEEAMAQLSAVGVPAGAVLDTQELIDEPSFYERGILQ